MNENLYRPLLRPASSFTLPRGVEWEYAAMPADIAHMRLDVPRSRHLFGVIRTKRELTADEIARFDLAPHHEGAL